MFSDKQIMEMLQTLSKRISATENKLDEFFNLLHEKNASNIDYLAMMTDVELDDSEEGVENDTQ